MPIFYKIFAQISEETFKCNSFSKMNEVMFLNA